MDSTTVVAGLPLLQSTSSSSSHDVRSWRKQRGGQSRRAKRRDETLLVRFITADDRAFGRDEEEDLALVEQRAVAEDAEVGDEDLRLEVGFTVVFGNTGERPSTPGCRQRLGYASSNESASVSSS